MQQNEDNVKYVADQIRDLKVFLEKCTGKTITEDGLKRTNETKQTYDGISSLNVRKKSADKDIKTDLVTPLFAGMTNNILLGTKEEREICGSVIKRYRKSTKRKKGKNIYWMHTIPFWSGAVQEALAFNENAQIAGCELSRTFEPDF